MTHVSIFLSKNKELLDIKEINTFTQKKTIDKASSSFAFIPLHTRGAGTKLPARCPHFWRRRRLAAPVGELHPARPSGIYLDSN